MISFAWQQHSPSGLAVLHLKLKLKEYINDHLLAWCQKRPAGEQVQFTRPRPYKKDGNGHVWQKNWTHVRKLVGWERYESREALAALNALYADLRLFQNLFQPSMKLVSKERVGSRRIRRYDAPLTPFERVRGCPAADPAKVAALRRVLKTRDPLPSPSASISVWSSSGLSPRRPVAPRARGRIESSEILRIQRLPRYSALRSRPAA